MVIIDTSAWIEFFRNGVPSVVERVEACLDQGVAAIGDLVYCEVMQGIRVQHQRRSISGLLLQLPQFEMVGFEIAERTANNYAYLRSRGVTIRKTIDVIIGTFCIENGFPLIHHDRDFDPMAKLMGLQIWSPPAR